ncbi:MAG TPA: ABC transporter substrate-binding protein [Xanthobacteraceae bacterium]|jgi:NitT/TauT family transport system substrate-binding protein|nr:ABC transporter substrate-binding protein [Xanthobacteraceae bacterium]
MQRLTLIITAALLAMAQPAASRADDLLKLAIGQRGLWDSSIAELGQAAGLFKKHGLDLQVVYTSGGGETQQAVISGSVDIGVAAGSLGVLSIFAKGAPVRIIAGEATGTAEYYFVKADSAVQKDFKGVSPTMTLAYSTNGSGTHITALRFMKQYGFSAKLVATGSVPATFTQVMSGQVDIGFSTPPFGLDAMQDGKIRLVALANDLDSVRTQTVRLIIANAPDLARRRDVYDRFLAAYRETIDWMYAGDAALPAYAKYAGISPATAKTVRDRFYPKAMLQLDEVAGLPELMQDAIAFKYIAKELDRAQLDELVQTKVKP